MSIRSFGPRVGSFMPSPIANALLTMDDSSQWLRAGLAVAAAGYPVAATLAHLRAHRFTRTATQITGATTAIATNGSGTFVACVPGNTANVYTSTDGGQTWAANAHNLPTGAFGPCAIVWTGTRFVAVGNDTSNVRAATSTDGVTWTGFNIATGLSATSGNTVDIAWDGSAVCVMVPGQSTTNTIYTSPSGLSGTWTARTTPASSPAVAGSSRLGGGALGFVYTYSNSGSQQITYSTDHGVTWSTVSGLPVPVTNNGKPMVGAGFVAVLSAGNVLNYSTNFTSWAGVTPSAAGYSPLVTQMAGGGWATTDANNQLLTTTDGVNWTVQVMGDSDPTKPGPSASLRLACVGNSSIVLANVNATDYLHYATSTPTSANAVGGSTATGHWRIK